MSLSKVKLVLHHSAAKHSDKMILVGIASYLGAGRSEPSEATLAHFAGIHEDNVRKSLRRLERLGELVTHVGMGRGPNGRRTNLYVIALRCPPWCDGSLTHKPRQRTDTPFPDLALPDP